MPASRRRRPRPQSVTRRGRGPSGPWRGITNAIWHNHDHAQPCCLPAASRVRPPRRVRERCAGAGPGASWPSSPARCPTPALGPAPKDGMRPAGGAPRRPPLADPARPAPGADKPAWALSVSPGGGGGTSCHGRSGRTRSQARRDGAPPAGSGRQALAFHPGPTWVAGGRCRRSCASAAPMSVSFGAFPSPVSRAGTLGRPAAGVLKGWLTRRAFQNAQKTLRKLLTSASPSFPMPPSQRRGTRRDRIAWHDAVFRRVSLSDGGEIFGSNEELEMNRIPVRNTGPIGLFLGRPLPLLLTDMCAGPRHLSLYQPDYDMDPRVRDAQDIRGYFDKAIDSIPELRVGTRG